MATYVALSDDPYSNRSEGRGFAYAGLVAGAVGLTGWAAMRGYLPGLRPADAFDQLLIAAMAWVGCGLFVLMGICAWVVIDRSARSRGTVTVNDVGVLRELGKRSWMLKWDEIEGIVTMGQEGATLVPRGDRYGIWIPGSLDDMQGCIAEITAKGIAYLPSDRLYSDSNRPRRKRAWWQWLLLYVYSYAVLLGRDAPASHAWRIVIACAWTGFFVWLVIDDERRGSRRWFAWFSLAYLVGLLILMACHLAHT